MPDATTTPANGFDKGTWVTSRADIRVLDCTVRDGGLMNNHAFEDGLVRAVYDTCIAAGIDYMEIGYKGSKRIFSPDQFGAWKFCTEDDIRRIVGDEPSQIKLCVMADAERTDYHTDIVPRDQSPLDVIRVASYIHQIPTAIDMVKDAHDKGYETTINIMAVSTAHEDDLSDALELVAQSPVGTIYLVDSFGTYYSEEVRALCAKYMAVARAAGKQLGFHGHNNVQLAYANTIEAIICGVNRLDATIMGLGRGAGNCPMELLLGFLKNPNYRLRPILQCIEKHVAPLQSSMKWGYDLAYMVTGQLNQHPRSAIQYYDEDEAGGIVAFYDQMVE
jgi:4-hydroxy 2-oxovalerate aldolase